MAAPCPHLACAPSASLRVIEFYSGAGGFHFALLDSGADIEVVASFDINTNANKVYEHNFPHGPHLNRNICGLTAQELDGYSADVFVLSPPCQPFTRQGLRRDNADRRTDSFFHLMLTLTEMVRLPSYILTENVQGFESSNTREHYVTVLGKLGYDYQEFLLSPVQFGIPNSRLRYYLLARKKPLKLFLECGEQPCKSPQPILAVVAMGKADEHLSHKGEESKQPHPQPIPCFSLETRSEVDGVGAHCTSTADSLRPSPSSLCSSSTLSPALPALRPTPTLLPIPITRPPFLTPLPLSAYLERLSEAELQHHLVPKKILNKYAIALDIVNPSLTHSCCFTKAYGNYAVGTGSVLQHAISEDFDEAFREFLALQKAGDTDSCSQPLLPLQLRYFTPKEVANLMCFPTSFSFPRGLSVRQCYKVMGNSLNVHVVSVLLRYLFHSP